VTGAVAERRDGAAVQFDEVLGDGETEAEAELLARRGRIFLPESFEDVRQEIA